MTKTLAQRFEVFRFSTALVAMATIGYHSYGKYPVTQNTQHGFQ